MIPNYTNKQPTRFYLMSDREFYKVGITSDVEKRLARIQYERNKRVDVIFSAKLRQVRFIETEIKYIFSPKCVGREWFNFDKDDIMQIRFICEKTALVENDSVIMESEQKFLYRNWQNLVLECKFYKTKCGMFDFYNYHAIAYVPNMEKSRYRTLPTTPLLPIIYPTEPSP